jgi:hypothetical protein
MIRSPAAVSRAACGTAPRALRAPMTRAARSQNPAATRDREHNQARPDFPLQPPDDAGKAVICARQSLCWACQEPGVQTRLAASSLALGAGERGQVCAYPLRSRLPDVQPGLDRTDRGNTRDRKLTGEQLDSLLMQRILPNSARSVVCVS